MSDSVKDDLYSIQAVLEAYALPKAQEMGEECDVTYALDLVRQLSGAAPGVRDGEGVDTSQWKCPQCRTFNHQLRRRCRTCLTAAPLVKERSVVTDSRDFATREAAMAFFEGVDYVNDSALAAHAPEEREGRWVVDIVDKDAEVCGTCKGKKVVLTEDWNEADCPECCDVNDRGDSVAEITPGTAPCSEMGKALSTSWAPAGWSARKVAAVFKKLGVKPAGQVVWKLRSGELSTANSYDFAAWRVLLDHFKKTQGFVLKQDAFTPPQRLLDAVEEGDECPFCCAGTMGADVVGLVCQGECGNFIGRPQPAGGETAPTLTDAERVEENRQDRIKVLEHVIHRLRSLPLQDSQCDDWHIDELETILGETRGYDKPDEGTKVEGELHDLYMVWQRQYEDADVPVIKELIGEFLADVERVHGHLQTTPDRQELSDRLHVKGIEAQVLEQQYEAALKEANLYRRALVCAKLNLEGKGPVALTANDIVNAIILPALAGQPSVEVPPTLKDDLYARRRFWIALYENGDGEANAFPIYSYEQPSDRDAAAQLEDYCSDATYIELSGPWDVKLPPVPVDPFWIIVYEHKHGTDVWPWFDTEPTLEEVVAEMAKEGTEFEGEDNHEYLNFYGPFYVRSQDNPKTDAKSFERISGMLKDLATEYNVQIVTAKAPPTSSPPWPPPHGLLIVDYAGLLKR